MSMFGTLRYTCHDANATATARTRTKHATCHVWSSLQTHTSNIPHVLKRCFFQFTILSLPHQNHACRHDNPEVCYHFSKM